MWSALRSGFNYYRANNQQWESPWNPPSISKSYSNSGSWMLSTLKSGQWYPKKKHANNVETLLRKRKSLHHSYKPNTDSKKNIFLESLTKDLVIIRILLKAFVLSSCFPDPTERRHKTDLREEEEIWKSNGSYRRSEYLFVLSRLQVHSVGNTRD